MILTPPIEAYSPPHFNLERTSLSLIVFGFRKATLGGDIVERYEVWVILGNN